MIVYVLYSTQYPYLPLDVCDSLKDVSKCWDVPYKTLCNYVNDEKHVYRASFTICKVYIPKSDNPYSLIGVGAPERLGSVKEPQRRDGGPPF